MISQRRFKAIDDYPLKFNWPGTKGLMLQGYTYDLVHKVAERHHNADALSRLPCDPPPRDRNIPMPGEVIQLLKAVESMPITAKEIANQTRRDPTMSKVQQYVLMGWPTSIDEHFKAFHRVKGELSIVDTIVFCMELAR